MEFEEPFQPYLRRIRELDTDKTFSTKVGEITQPLERLSAVMADGKKRGNLVLPQLDELIKAIDQWTGIKQCNSSQQAVEDTEKSLRERMESCLQRIQSIQICLDQNEMQLNKYQNEETSMKHKDERPERTEKEDAWIECADKNMTVGVEMSYHHLEPILQRCLLFLSVFPDDAIIKKRTIIYWWMGERLVTATRGQTAEQVGEEYFEMLLLSGLILPIMKKHDKSARGCKLHPMVRSMLKSLWEGYSAFQYYSEDELMRDENGYCPVACFRRTPDNQQQMVVSWNAGQAVSLFNVSARYLTLGRDLSTLYSIKVLQLGRWDRSARDNIEVEVHSFLNILQNAPLLTYLSLEGIMGIRKLPNTTVSRLTNLCVLNVQACHSLETLPTGVTSLRNLTHLDVSECTLIDRIPKGLHNLSELQVLKGFVVCRDKSTDSCRIGDLVGLKKLRKLSINIPSGVSSDSHLEELSKLTCLRSVTITWGRVIEEEPVKPVLWRSGPNIEKLDLRRFPHRYMLEDVRPSQFPKLRKFYIRGGNVERFTPMTNHEQWKVETLRLRFLGQLSNDESELKEIFPYLTEIDIWKCPRARAKA